MAIGQRPESNVCPLDDCILIQKGGGPTISHPKRRKSSATCGSTVVEVGAGCCNRTDSSNTFPASPGVYMKNARPVPAPLFFQACGMPRGMNTHVPGPPELTLSPTLT